jgi:two-component system sensor histidine kinase VicK
LITDTGTRYFQSFDEHNNQLEIMCNERLPEVKADADYIARIFVNLIHNATRFTHNGNITVSAAHTANNVTVSIEDTGCGIPPERLAFIFDKFYTNGNSTGTGLGLYICKKIIDAHGGEIKVQNKPGCGTKVSFTLPVWEDNIKNE